MGIDLGDKRIGVALSDPLGITAYGLMVMERTNITEDIRRILEIAAQYDVAEIVCGLPRNMDGTLGLQAEKVQTFTEKLKNKTKLAVHLWDERLTSKAAGDILIDAGMRRKQRKMKVDQVAAAIILQGYLSRRTHRRENCDI